MKLKLPLVQPLSYAGLEQRFEYLHYVTLLQVSGEQGLYHKHLLPFTAIS